MNGHFERGSNYPYCAVAGPKGFAVADMRNFPKDHDQIKNGNVAVWADRETAEQEARAKNQSLVAA